MLKLYEVIAFADDKASLGSLKLILILGVTKLAIAPVTLALAIVKVKLLTSFALA